MVFTLGSSELLLQPLFLQMKIKTNDKIFGFVTATYGVYAQIDHTYKKLIRNFHFLKSTNTAPA